MHKQHGRAINGMAMVAIPPELTNAQLQIVALNDPRKLDIRPIQQSPGVFSIQFFHQGRPVEEDIEYELTITVPRNLLRAPKEPPKPVTLFNLQVGPEMVFLDLAYAPPFVSPETIPEQSIEPHSSVVMARSQAEQLMISLQAALGMLAARQGSQPIPD
jgi:hypothetical protein